MTVGIYVIQHLVSGRCYVGSAVDIKRRWRIHRWALKAGLHHSRALQLAWAKYGAEAFEFAIAETVTDTSVLVDREQHWIDRLRAYGHGYNGKAKAASSLGYKHTPEARAKMSAAKKGQPSPKRGMPISDAHRAALSRARKGRPLPLDQVERLRALHTGRKRSPETCRRISEGKRRNKEGVS